MALTSLLTDSAGNTPPLDPDGGDMVWEELAARLWGALKGF